MGVFQNCYIANEHVELDVSKKILLSVESVLMKAICWSCRVMLRKLESAKGSYFFFNTSWMMKTNWKQIFKIKILKLHKDWTKHSLNWKRRQKSIDMTSIDHWWLAIESTLNFLRKMSCQVPLSDWKIPRVIANKPFSVFMMQKIKS